MTERWIGLDVGTTHIKAVAIDGVTRTIRTTPTPASADGDGVARDPQAVVDAARHVLREVIDADRSKPVAAISVASVGEEIVLVDDHASPVAPVLAWFDTRGHDDAARFAPTGLHERFPPDPSWSLFKLLWLKRERPIEVAAARLVLDLGSFVLRTLGAPAVMDWSHASRTAVFDPEATRWDPETLGRLDLDLAWPELVPSGLDLGPIDRDVATELCVSPATRLIAGGHDHFVGAFGSGIRSSGDGYLSAGTSEAMLVLTRGPIAACPGIDQGRFVDADHWYLHVAAPGGHVYGQWRGLLYPGADDALVRGEVSARQAPAGCLVAIDRVAHRATLLDVPMAAERAQLLRAVVEGAAISSARTFEHLAAMAPGGVARLVVAGHAADDDLWRSLRLGLLDRPMEVVREQEITAVGAALLARAGATGDTQPLAPTERFVPTATDLALAAELRERYQLLERNEQ